jgi:hypothetical protein
MQVTETAFQTGVSLKKPATDPKSHTPVSNPYTKIAACNSWLTRL